MRSLTKLSSLLVITAAGAASTMSSCSSTGNTSLGPSTFTVAVTAVNGSAVPTVATPLPASHGLLQDKWSFTIKATTPTGDLADFTGWVRLSLAPGTVIGIDGQAPTDPTMAPNVLLTNGTATGVAVVTGAYGPSALWVEDLGYHPAAANTTPACANGVDDNGNGLIDFPADPGCYYADDDTEDGGSYAAGVSQPVQYALPKISDVRGHARTPYGNEAIEIATSDPEYLVVTRISSGGFYVTDLNPTEVANGYNSLYAFNFDAPPNMRVCDRITYLSGTANDFFGFTQLSFPSFNNTFVVLGQDGGTFIPDGGTGMDIGCRVPEPTVLAPSLFSDKNTTSDNLYPFESGLVRLEGFTVAENFGSNFAFNQVFKPGQSNCDFNGDGQIDYTQVHPNCPTGQCEGDCATDCDDDPHCTEWTSYSARNNFKVYNGMAMVQLDTSSVATFDPPTNAGKKLPFVTGTLTEFSGGDLNWTVEVRCTDDLVCDAASGCTTQAPLSSQTACVRPRTIDDNDEGTD